MDYRDWHVGMKVVCILRNKVVREGYAAKCSFPMVGGVYSIRRIGVIEGHVAVLLDEIRNPIGNLTKGFDGETGFYAAQFRPVQPRATDISIFTALLTKAPTPEKEPA